jgi:hypothetical protein
MLTTIASPARGKPSSGLGRLSKRFAFDFLLIGETAFELPAEPGDLKVQGHVLVLGHLDPIRWKLVRIHGAADLLRSFHITPSMADS